MLKQDLQQALLSHRGTEISGQELATTFGVSRNAIWKTICALRDEGWDIHSGPRRGYLLADSCDRLSEPYLRSLLQNDPATASLPVYIYDRIDSTNNECKRRLGNGEKRFLVLAEEQTGGRGRNGKNFFSPGRSGLYMSLAMPMQSGFADAVGVTSYTAVAIAEAVERLTGVQCGIKWVNDLYTQGRKVCGILTEAVGGLELGTVDTVVIGLGINLHPMPEADLPPALREIVGWLGCGPVKNELSADIAARLLSYTPHDRAYMDRYRARSLVLSAPVQYTINGVDYHGIGERIDDDGALTIRRDDGAVDVLRSGEVSLSLR